MKKLILVLVSFIFFFSFNLAQASDIIINEFVSHPNSGEEEWIELFNTTESSIDLTNWKLTQLSNPSTTPKEDNPLILSDTILGGGVFVIKISNLNNGGDSISLYDPSDSLVSRVTYGKVVNISTDLDFPFQGRSGALISGVWETNQEPTRGMQNPNSSPISPVDDSSNDSSSPITTQPESKIKVVENPTMKVKILASALAFTGQPLEIKTDVTGFSNEKVVLGRASWNFGDGSSFEQINNFEKFSHIYYYPGEYVLFLEYYQNSFSKTPEVTSKMIIKVLSTNVFISKVGDAKDFFIELSNNASSDIDISNWVINANGKTFIFPRNSVIMSKKQMTISGKITGFTLGDQNNLKLYSGTGELIFDYSSSKIPVVAMQDQVTDVGHLDSRRGTSVILTSSTAVQPLENLGANVLQSNVISSDNVDNSSMPIIPITSFIFIGASAFAVYFIRRKKVIPENVDDFEILDE